VHIFNRILVILGLLTIMVISVILFLAWGPFLQILIGVLQQTNAALTALADTNPLLRWAGGFGLTVAVWAACIALLWLETRRPRARTITVQQVSGGHAELTVDSIISRLQYNLEQMPDIIRVWPRVRSARKGVRIDMSVETNPEVEVPAITEEIRQRTRDIMEQQMGLKLESMRVVIRHAPYPKSFFKGERVELTSRAPTVTQRPVPSPRPSATPSTPSTVSPATSPTPPPVPSAAGPVPVTPPPASQPVAEVVPPASPTVEPSQPEEEGSQERAEVTTNDNRERSWRLWPFSRPHAEETASASSTTEAATQTAEDTSAMDAESALSTPPSPDNTEDDATST